MSRPDRLPYPRVRPRVRRYPDGTVEDLGLFCGSAHFPDGKSIHLCFGSKEFAPWITGKGPTIIVSKKSRKASKG